MKSAQFFGENTDIPLLDKDDMLLGEYMVYTSTQVDTDDFFYADWKDAGACALVRHRDYGESL